MKAQQIISLKMAVFFPVIILFLTNACTHSANKNKPKSKNNTEVRATVAKPEMDLQAAIISGNLDVVKQHIEAGTDINTKEQNGGSTPLITAATFGKKDITKALIDAHVDLNLKNNEGSTALHAAAFFCRIEIVQMLIDAGLDKNIKNNHYATARQSVTVPFTEMKPVYEMISKQLEPLGLKLDIKEIETTRPIIAMMLQ